MAHRNHALLLAGWLLGSSALAHDTWFEPQPAERPGNVRLRLGTGNRFPHHEFSVGQGSLRQQGCRPAGGRVVPLQVVGDSAQALSLSARTPGTGPVSCWAQQQPFELTLKPETVEVYLQEIRAPASVRAAWAVMQARGVAWQERYTKHARIELPGSTASAWATPTGMGLDVLLQSGLQPAQVGDTLVFQLLRDGQPLAGQAVELRSDLSPIGQWHQTDAEGRVHFQPPLAAQWILRATDLRLAESPPDTWESRFVTLAFRVAERR